MNNKSSSNRKILEECSSFWSAPIILLCFCIFVYLFVNGILALIQNNHKRKLNVISELNYTVSELQSENIVLKNQYDMLTSHKSLARLMLDRGLELKNTDLNSIIASNNYKTPDK